MKRTLARFINFSILSVVLPFVYGCQTGGGGGLASALGVSGPASPAATGGTGDGGATIVTTLQTGPETIATIHNPEPATMLLLTGGLAAMAVYKRKISR